jgi:hypothetical protein
MPGHVLHHPARDTHEFSWLQPLVVHLCGDCFSNPFKEVRSVDTNSIAGSPASIENEAEEDSDNSGQSISDATSDAKAFPRLVRFV